MKKLKYLLLILLAGVVITGCGGSSDKVVKCTISNDAANYTATYEISVDDKDYVKSVKTTEVLKSEDDSYLSQAKAAVEELYKASNDLYGGYSYSVKVSGNTLTSTCTIDYKKMNVKKYVEDTPELTNFADEDGNVKLAGVKEIYEALGAKCE